MNSEETLGLLRRVADDPQGSVDLLLDCFDPGAFENFCGEVERRLESLPDRLALILGEEMLPGVHAATLIAYGFAMRKEVEKLEAAAVDNP